MGNPRGVKRDFVALEKRRFQAVKLFDKDLNNSEIGRRLKVSNQTVSRWRKEHQEGGEVALRRAGRAGRLPCLHEADKARLVELLHQGPEALGYETPLWTCERVAHLIDKNFDVEYHPGHVWRILRQLNWSVQLPVGRALERNEGMIDDWKRNRWPAIKKSSKRRTHNRLHRRKWSEPAAPPAAHLGAAWADAGFAVPLQLEDLIGHRRGDPLELLLSDLRGLHQVRASHRVPQALAPLYTGRHPADLGPASGSQKQAHPSIHPGSERPLGCRVPPALRAGTEPGGVHLGTLQAP